MATDCDGNYIDIGDTVTKVGYSDEYIISNIKYGGEVLELSGENWVEDNVRVQDVIKVG